MCTNITSSSDKNNFHCPVPILIQWVFLLVWPSSLLIPCIFRVYIKMVITDLIWCIYIYIKSNGLCLSTLPQRVLNTHMHGWLLWLLKKVQTQVICTTMVSWIIPIVRQSKTDLIHRQVMRPLRFGGSHFVAASMTWGTHYMSVNQVSFWLPDDWYYPWNHGRTYDLSLDFFQQLYIYIYIYIYTKIRSVITSSILDLSNSKSIHVHFRLRCCPSPILFSKSAWRNTLQSAILF